MAMLDKLRPEALSRRTFLVAAGGAGVGLMVGCAPAGSVAPDFKGLVGPFVRIATDGTVTTVVKHLEMGQGIMTGLATIVAEELDADWAKMKTEFAPADVRTYGNIGMGGMMQATGGSSSIAGSWDQLRKAAAGARAMLVEAAAAAWGVPAAEITVAKGVISHAASGKSDGFGAFAEAAAQLKPPEAPTLKDPKDFTLVGKTAPRLDSTAKTTGAAKFTLDLYPDDVRIAVIAHPDKFGATVASYDASATLKVPGVVRVVQVPRGVAVVADNTWAALKGRAALKVTWDDAKAETRSSDEMMAAFKETAKTPGAPFLQRGDAAAGLKSAATVIEADYAFPFLAHATMEPMDCIAQVSRGKCEIWTASQIQTIDQAAAAAALGLRPDQVIVHSQMAGGSFGRRANFDADYTVEAVTIARAMGDGKPVKLMWTREDDFRAGKYRPMVHHRVRAGVSADGKLTGWTHTIAGISLGEGTPFALMRRNGLDSSLLEGISDTPYGFAHFDGQLHITTAGVPTLWWRSVGHTHTAYALETMVDRVAKALNKDPVAFRRELLAAKDATDAPRHLGVLNLASEKAGWGAPVPAGKARGVALHKSFGTYVAQVAELALNDDGTWKVEKVTVAVDCGIAINPDVVVAQMEGGVGFALSAIKHEQITLTKGVVDQANFPDYRVLRIGEMPQVDVHIVPSGEAPKGVGEPGVPPLGPAVANAIFAATGKTVTALPIGETI